VGQWEYIDAQGQTQIVDGVQLISREDDNDLFTKYGVGGIDPKDDNILDLAAANGATKGNIGKMRGVLTDMSQQADVTLEVANLLLGMEDPEWVLDLTGKTAVQANRIVRFVENGAEIIAAADGGEAARRKYLESKHTFNGEETGGAHDQYKQFINRGKDEGFLLGTLNKLSSEQGLPGGSSLADFLPEGIANRLVEIGAGSQEIARVAEQYWANVMELAYMDAKLKEPSNRGLSDKDIGAATASPASLAQRQLSLTNRIAGAIDSLGDIITIPRGSRTQHRDVVDFIYAPKVRNKAAQGVARAQTALHELFAQSVNPINQPSPQNPPGAATNPSNPNAPGQTALQIALETAETPEQIPGFVDMSPAEQAEFRQLWTQFKGQQ
jgi:hypothetical protein